MRYNLCGSGALVRYKTNQKPQTNRHRSHGILYTVQCIYAFLLVQHMDSSYKQSDYNIYMKNNIKLKYTTFEK